MKQSVNIYQNQTTLKWIIFSLTALIGVISLLYSRQMAIELTIREEKQIDLFAKSQKLLTNGEDHPIMTNFLLTEIINDNQSIPMILTSNGIPMNWKNLDIPEGLGTLQRMDFLLKEIKVMKQEYPPIEVPLSSTEKQFIYYRHSDLLTRLNYFPFIQLSSITVFFALGYLVLSSSRRSEQNRVWVGLAKETAHQLGTPISALMAWMEYLRADPDFDNSIVDEMDKDIVRLETITARFSKIGSVNTTVEEDVAKLIKKSVAYLQNRVSTKVSIKVVEKVGQTFIAPINVHLFEWVIENLCKNAVDAMEGRGKIEIYLRKSKDDRLVEIDISDTGKGIPHSKLKAIFRPGYTTKKRGWGLGLTLVKRIVEDYHDGKIYVRKSEINKGTTFRILLPTGPNSVFNFLKPPSK